MVFSQAVKPVMLSNLIQTWLLGISTFLPMFAHWVFHVIQKPLPWQVKDMPQTAQRCDLEIEFLEVQGSTIVVPDLTNCQVRLSGDVPVFV